MSETVDEHSKEEQSNNNHQNDQNENDYNYEMIGKRLVQRTNAYGKLILFGEHFVVYHVPALVGAISDYTNCYVELLDVTTTTKATTTSTTTTTTMNTIPTTPGVTILDHRPAVPNYKIQKAEEGEQAIKLVLDHLHINYQHQYHVICTFGGTLTCVSGIGASAAQVVALARALQYEIPQPMTLDEINMTGYEGEKGYHGTPSGIDNTAATFGGLLKFQRTETTPIFTKFTIFKPIPIVFASTGITASTTTVVSDVRNKKDADPIWFQNLLNRYMILVEKAEKAILDHNLILLGQLLDENHILCQELTVSCSELDHLVTTAKTSGALGAKMSGTGRGGLMLALCETIEQQDTIVKALETAGAAQVWKTTLA